MSPFAIGAAFIVMAFGVLAYGYSDEIVAEVEVHLDWWTQYDVWFKDAAAQNGIARLAGVDGWKILKAISLNESDLGRAASVARGIANPDDIAGSVSSDKKSWGIMQFTLPTARDMDSGATERKLNDPFYSIELAGKFVAWIEAQFNPLEPRFLEFVIKSYNQGVGNSRKERAGTGGGYANEYWARFQRHLARVEESV